MFICSSYPLHSIKHHSSSTPNQPNTPAPTIPFTTTSMTSDQTCLGKTPLISPRRFQESSRSFSNIHNCSKFIKNPLEKKFRCICEEEKGVKIISPNYDYNWFLNNSSQQKFSSADPLDFVRNERAFVSPTYGSQAQAHCEEYDTTRISSSDEDNTIHFPIQCCKNNLLGNPFNDVPSLVIGKSITQQKKKKSKFESIVQNPNYPQVKLFVNIPAEVDLEKVEEIETLMIGGRTSDQIRKLKILSTKPATPQQHLQVNMPKTKGFITYKTTIPVTFIPINSIERSDDYFKTKIANDMPSVINNQLKVILSDPLYNVSLSFQPDINMQTASVSKPLKQHATTQTLTISQVQPPQDDADNEKLTLKKEKDDSSNAVFPPENRFTVKSSQFSNNRTPYLSQIPNVPLLRTKSSSHKEKLKPDLKPNQYSSKKRSKSMVTQLNSLPTDSNLDEHHFPKYSNHLDEPIISRKRSDSKKYFSPKKVSPASSESSQIKRLSTDLSNSLQEGMSSDTIAVIDSFTSVSTANFPIPELSHDDLDILMAKKLSEKKDHRSNSFQGSLSIVDPVITQKTKQNLPDFKSDRSKSQDVNNSNYYRTSIEKLTVSEIILFSENDNVILSKDRRLPLNDINDIAHEHRNSKNISYNDLKEHLKLLAKTYVLVPSQETLTVEHVLFLPKQSIDIDDSPVTEAKQDTIPKNIEDTASFKQNNLSYIEENKKKQNDDKAPDFFFFSETEADHSSPRWRSPDGSLTQRERTSVDDIDSPMRGNDSVDQQKDSSHSIHKQIKLNENQIDKHIKSKVIVNKEEDKDDSLSDNFSFNSSIESQDSVSAIQHKKSNVANSEASKTHSGLSIDKNMKQINDNIIKHKSAQPPPISPLQNSNYTNSYPGNNSSFEKFNSVIDNDSIMFGKQALSKKSTIKTDEKELENSLSKSSDKELFKFDTKPKLLNSNFSQKSIPASEKSIPAFDSKSVHPSYTSANKFQSLTEQNNKDEIPKIFKHLKDEKDSDFDESIASSLSSNTSKPKRADLDNIINALLDEDQPTAPSKGSKTSLNKKITNKTLRKKDFDDLTQVSFAQEIEADHSSPRWRSPDGSLTQRERTSVDDIDSSVTGNDSVDQQKDSSHSIHKQIKLNENQIDKHIKSKVIANKEEDKDDSLSDNFSFDSSIETQDSVSAIQHKKSNVANGEASKTHSGLSIDINMKQINDNIIEHGSDPRQSFNSMNKFQSFIEQNSKDKILKFLKDEKDSDFVESIASSLSSNTSKTKKADLDNIVNALLDEDQLAVPNRDSKASLNKKLTSKRSSNEFLKKASLSQNSQKQPAREPETSSSSFTDRQKDSVHTLLENDNSFENDYQNGSEHVMFDKPVEFTNNLSDKVAIDSVTSFEPEIGNFTLENKKSKLKHLKSKESKENSRTDISSIASKESKQRFVTSTNRASLSIRSSDSSNTSVESRPTDKPKTKKGADINNISKLSNHVGNISITPEKTSKKEKKVYNDLPRETSEHGSNKEQNHKSDESIPDEVSSLSSNTLLNSSSNQSAKVENSIVTNTKNLQGEVTKKKENSTGSKNQNNENVEQKQDLNNSELSVEESMNSLEF